MNSFLKRSFDILLALSGLALFLPILVATGILIVGEDGGPLFFLQERNGMNNKIFKIIKFRTMYQNKVTRVGRWIRARGLDEIPQIWNVFKGDMSIVGPRPLTMLDTDRLGWSAPAFQFRISVRPGITGLAQLYGGNGKRISLFLDKYYIGRRSLFLDIWIIMLSFGVNIWGKARIRQMLYGKRSNIRS